MKFLKIEKFMKQEQMTQSFSKLLYLNYLEETDKISWKNSLLWSGWWVFTGEISLSCSVSWDSSLIGNHALILIRQRNLGEKRKTFFSKIKEISCLRDKKNGMLLLQVVKLVNVQKVNWQHSKDLTLCLNKLSVIYHIWWPKTLNI